MHNDLVESGWTEDHWNRITSVVTEEAQRARVASQLLPVTGPVDPSTVAVPNFTFSAAVNAAPPPPALLDVNSDPDLFITTIAVNVPLRSVEVADTDLSAALVKFRRAANYIARLEDSIILNGPLTNGAGAPVGALALPLVYDIAGRWPTQGIFWPGPGGGRFITRIGGAWPATGNDVVNSIIRAIERLDGRGQLGPFACVLGDRLFRLICSPTANLVLPRDRILPFLGGPLLRSSAVAPGWGAIMASSGRPIEVVVASDISVRFLQTTLEPRFVFRVSERIALRVSQDDAIEIIN
jgi:uncharacterized linocin/CFP29 family protein